MSHELELVNGEAQMFYRGDAPWHNLGRFIDPEKHLTSEEAIVAAGLDWEVKTQPLYLGDSTLVPSNKAVVREDNNEVLGVVGKNYTPLQNRKAFEFFDPFIESNGASFETAGSLKGGKKIWALAKINQDPMEIMKNDIVEKYVLLSNGHDGTVSLRVGFTPIRVVCQNTLSMAIGNSASQLIRLKHTSNIEENLDKVGEIMNLANQEFEATAEQYRFLSNKTVNTKDLERLVKLVFVGENYLEEEKLGIERGKRIFANVLELFETGRGTEVSGVKGTAWGAYNAVNEYLQYERGSDDDNRLDKMWFGDSATMNRKALDIITKMVA
jgi:phage/plasmid-like protein (TIGR03299 family)